jgi:putative transposase
MSLQVVTVMDAFTREGLALEVATSWPAPRGVAVLEPLVATHGAPHCGRRDNGPEFIALGVRTWLAQPRMRTLSSTPGRPWQNGYGESCHGTGRDEGLHRHIFHAGAEARVVLAGYRRPDTEARPHRRLGDRTPAEFQREWLERQA